MITTVLLDLDNTLLGNDMKTFLPPYFAALQRRMQNLAGEQDLQTLMYASTQAIQANEDPAVDNLTAFMVDFSQRLGQPAGVIQALLETLYQEDYPHLQRYTTRRAEAAQVIRRLFDDGLTVVIATNPLFPAVAIEQRLQWAGIADFPYALVTTMENSHFSKPNPRYYRAILDRVGSAPGESWMVGDDPVNDIAPARIVGLKTWWITAGGEPETGPACDRQGTLAEFLRWVEEGGLKET